MSLVSRIVEEALDDPNVVLNGIVLHPMTFYDLRFEPGVRLFAYDRDIRIEIMDGGGYPYQVDLVLDDRIPPGELLFAKTNYQPFWKQWFAPMSAFDPKPITWAWASNSTTYSGSIGGVFQSDAAFTVELNDDQQNFSDDIFKKWIEPIYRQKK